LNTFVHNVWRLQFLIFFFFFFITFYFHKLPNISNLLFETTSNVENWNIFTASKSTNDGRQEKLIIIKLLHLSFLLESMKFEHYIKKWHESWVLSANFVWFTPFNAIACRSRFFETIALRPRLVGRWRMWIVDIG